MVGVPDLGAPCDDPAVAATGEVGFVCVWCVEGPMWGTGVTDGCR